MPDRHQPTDLDRLRLGLRRSPGPEDPRRPTAEHLRFAVTRCQVTEAALEALDDGLTPIPAEDYEREEIARTRANRDARDELVGCLLGLLEGAPAEPVAVVLPDGSVAAYTPEQDGLAVVPASRVFRVEG